MTDLERLTKRDGVWHFQRRVPIEYQEYDKRNPVRLSTKVKVATDRRGIKATAVADRLNLDLEAFWRSCVGGRAAEARQTYDEAVKRSRALGLDYVEAPEAAAAPLHDVLGRIEALMQGRRADDPVTTSAVLGAVPKPKIKLTEIYSEFVAATRDEMVRHSPKQLKKWKRAKENALNVFLAAIDDGGMDMADMTREHALKYRRYWQDRVVDEGIQPGTANKNITHVSGMFNRLNELHHLGLDSIFAGIRLKKGKSTPRRPFDVKFVQERLLADGALMTLNPEARRILFTVVDTGARPSEIANLSEASIIIEADIPRIIIRPDGRVLKTDHSERVIPLVGAALAAMKEARRGFPRYRDNEDSLSAALNKYLDDRGLLGEGQSVYSLRHTFKDRLRAANAQEEMIDELMGHLTNKPEYGEGYLLAQKFKLLQSIAFVPPAAV
ncbi:hypothetical protein AFEL58S_02083 [Afipia felis]